MHILLGVVSCPNVQKVTRTAWHATGPPAIPFLQECGDASKYRLWSKHTGK